jgi:ribosomal protein S18 acetylase RimI-like enzyme
MPDPSDIDFLKRVEDEKDVGPFIRPWTRAEHKSGLADTRLTYFVSIDEASQSKVGFLIFRSNPSAPETIEFVRLAMARRGQGYGRATIRAVIAYAKAKALTSIWLEVFPNNERARAAYEKEGFAEVSRSRTERGFGGEPGEVIRMERPL